MIGNLERLKQAVDELRRVPFPSGSDDEIVDDLHAELAELDGYTMGIVSQLLSGRSKLPHRLLSGDELRASLERIRADGGAAAKDAERQLEYLDPLRAVIAAAMRLE